MFVRNRACIVVGEAAEGTTCGTEDCGEDVNYAESNTVRAEQGRGRGGVKQAARPSVYPDPPQVEQEPCCEWADWGAWSESTATCGVSNRTRSALSRHFYEYCENYREITLPSLTVADQGPEVRVSARELPRTRALRLRPQERRGPVRRGGGQGLPEGGHVFTLHRY